MFSGSKSEVCSTSDTISLVLRIQVRSFFDFGHYLACSTNPSPKFFRLRTLSRLFGDSLSEVCSTLYTILLVWRSLVRSLLGFGHNLTCSTNPSPKLARLRTLSHLFYESMSEVCTTSDTISLVLRTQVRSWLGFRHNLACSAIPCPKFARLRTLSHLFYESLSEVCWTSDTILPVRRFLVRSWLDFRHNLACSANPCPKFARLRTLSHLFYESLSKVFSTSDTISLVQRFQVRSLLDFGHDLACSAIPCPKFARLLTQSRLFGGPKSEVCSNSDTIPLVRWSLVRSLLDFGHYPACSAILCPNLTPLQTLSRLFGGPLSEVSSASDTIPLVRRCLVRS